MVLIDIPKQHEQLTISLLLKGTINCIGLTPGKYLSFKQRMKVSLNWEENNSFVYQHIFSYKFLKTMTK